MRVLLLLILLGLAATCGWFARDLIARQPKDTAPTAELNTVRVVRGRLEQSIKARGLVKPAPNGLIRIGFPMPKDVSRRIRKLAAGEGDTVKAGAPLAELDDDDLRATLKYQSAEADVVQRRLDALHELEPVQVRAAEAMVTEREGQLDLAQRNHDRLAKLVEGDVTNRKTFDQAVGELAVAKARLAQARAAVEQTRASSSVPTPPRLKPSSARRRYRSS